MKTPTDFSTGNADVELTWAAARLSEFGQTEKSGRPPIMSDLPAGTDIVMLHVQIRLVPLADAHNLRLDVRSSPQERTSIQHLGRGNGPSQNIRYGKTRPAVSNCAAAAFAGPSRRRSLQLRLSLRIPTLLMHLCARLIMPRPRAYHHRSLR